MALHKLYFPSTTEPVNTSFPPPCCPVQLFFFVPCFRLQDTFEKRSRETSAEPPRPAEPYSSDADGSDIEDPPEDGVDEGKEDNDNDDDDDDDEIV